MIATPRRRALLVPTLVAMILVVALSACGSGPSTASSPASETSSRSAASAAVISASTRMICATEGKDEIGAAIGIEPIHPLAPVWHDHVYSCDYLYARGELHLSVKQLADAAATKHYVAALATRLGKREALQGLGQGAFTTTNGSVVVNKDNKVLLVDVHDLPAEFGKPLDTRANVGITIAATIMGCWTEA